MLQAYGICVILIFPRHTLFFEDHIVEFIPNALLTPEEFSRAKDEAILGNTLSVDYLTSRMIILVPDDGWYTFTRISTDFQSVCM